jgi:hypothetical protein
MSRLLNAPHGYVLVLLAGSILVASSTLRADEQFARAQTLIKKHCVECHNNDESAGNVNFEQLQAQPDFARNFRIWRQAVWMLEQNRMPPKNATNLPQNARKLLQSAIRQSLSETAQRHAADPGEFVLRRLTRAEYQYSVLDLTGLALDFDQVLAGDAAGGEGFANVGSVQFMQDSTLEQYLQAAKQVANRTVIGSGPLQFYSDPGKTGFELSAISRITDIYRAHGFRTAAGEGGEAFGLERYARAFSVAWRFLHREKLGQGRVTLAQLARDEDIDVRFAEYIWKLFTRARPLFPTSDIVAKWHKLPAPPDTSTQDSRDRLVENVRKECRSLHAVMLDWQNRFGQNADAKEEAPVLSVESFNVSNTQLFEMNINWPKGTKTAHLRINIESANRDGNPNAVIVWHQPEIQWRIPDKVRKPFVPLVTILDKPNKVRLRFGDNSRIKKIAATDFATVGTTPIEFEVPIKAGATSAQLKVSAQLDSQLGDDCIVRCIIAQEEETDQGKQVSALLANPKGDAYELWKNGVVEFARVLPQVSQREPAPSDRDPIPEVFDNTYNNAERNHYHYKIKYYRDDRFVYDNILDDETRIRLDHAWLDLLGSFEYHDAYLRFIAKKFGVDLKGRAIRDADPDVFAELNPSTRDLVQTIKNSQALVDVGFYTARTGHVEDAVRLASRVWRRPVTSEEANGLRSFYRQLRSSSELDHAAAIRALITRIFMAPEFLYRAERTANAASNDDRDPKTPQQSVALTDWEIASRLSFFLWSSVPDIQLAKAAESGSLRDSRVLKQHTLRMLQDPKAQRLASEFFGQWFGFYRFDKYKGIDPKRFKEFDERLKKSMHQEAVAFFEHIIRQDRPIDEILFANYTFLNSNLRAHYGISDRHLPEEIERPILVRNLRSDHRGGLFGLGAVLTVTSAPLRTSAVKRGDWVLRRVMGTPVPPPPADAGSIPADDVLADGLTVRQRLEAHRKDAACKNCHDRIDPLGFALENYDPIGRWRDKYRDNQAIESSGKLSNGSRIDGPDGLRNYLKANTSLFHRTLSTKLTGYALGRRESISDVLLINRMMNDVKKGGRFSDLVLRIVTSPQFQTRRASSNQE